MFFQNFFRIFRGLKEGKSPEQVCSEHLEFLDQFTIDDLQTYFEDIENIVQKTMMRLTDPDEYAKLKRELSFEDVMQLVKTMGVIGTYTDFKALGFKIVKVQ